jgi:hypothetical protein
MICVSDHDATVRLWVPRRTTDVVEPKFTPTIVRRSVSGSAVALVTTNSTGLVFAEGGCASAVEKEASTRKKAKLTARADIADSWGQGPGKIAREA